MTEDSKKNSLRNTFTVQKSKPLLALWNSELTLQELKILDIYLSRIDSHNPDNQIVVFSKKEMEKVLGVSKINIQALQLRLKHMLSTIVDIPDRDDADGFRIITVFADAEAYRDETGTWMIRLECSPKAMKYIFNIESLGYIKYRLQCITQITSRYSYVMFMYLEDNKFRGEWNVSLEELREILGCESELYQQYRTLNERILAKVHDELNDKCSYDYTPIRENRAVVGIHIKMCKTQNEIEITNDTVNIDAVSSSIGLRDVWMSAVKDWNLSDCELAELRELIILIPYEKLPHVPAEIGCDDINLRRYHYIKQKVTEINRRKNDVRNKFLYIKKIIKSEINGCDSTGISW